MQRKCASVGADRRETLLALCESVGDAGGGTSTTRATVPRSER